MDRIWCWGGKGLCRVWSLFSSLRKERKRVQEPPSLLTTCTLVNSVHSLADVKYAWRHVFDHWWFLFVCVRDTFYETTLWYLFLKKHPHRLSFTSSVPPEDGRMDAVTSVVSTLCCQIKAWRRTPLLCTRRPIYSVYAWFFLVSVLFQWP